MVLRMDELNMPIDEIIFFDTGWEFPDIYRHHKKVEKYLDKKITTLKPKKSFNYQMFKFKTLSGKIGKAFPTYPIFWCRCQKIDRCKKYINDKYKKQGYKVIEYLGIAYDEQNRARSKEKNREIKYPLIEWRWTEKRCLEYCYNKGFYFNGLYKHFKRVSCYCCPLNSINDLRNLRKYYPKLWNKLLDMQSRCWNKYRRNMSIFDFEERFKNEDKQMKLSF